MASNKRGRPEKPQFPVYIQTVWWSFLKIFTREGVFHKLPDGRPNRREKATFVKRQTKKTKKNPRTCGQGLKDAQLVKATGFTEVVHW